jgi:CxxC motif-containing protein
MEEIQKLICISCPKGCTLEVTVDGDTVVKVSGETCKKGVDYAEKEISDPRRMIATTVRVKNGFHPLVPVYSLQPVPKPLIRDVLKELRKVELSAPVVQGSVVLENVLNTGVNIIASRDMPAS